MITGIIYKKIISGDFSFLLFYQRRVQRIIPLFVFVTLSCLLAGYYFQLPFDFKGLGNSAIAASLFLANVRYALVGNYFQLDSAKPLLHTWSLSVEEQYYFIWPLMIILGLYLFKTDNKFRFFILIMIVLSFSLAAYMSSKDSLSTYSYFLLPTRAGALLLGSYLAMCNIDSVRMKSRYKELITGLGIMTIILCYIFVDGNSSFPGTWSLVPCLAVVLVIWLGGETRTSKYLLSNKFMVYIGLLSFSIYMLHWPIIVFSRYILGVSEVGFIFSILIVLGVLFISWFTWYFIEQYFRRIKVAPIYAISFFYVLPTLFVLSICVLININQGFPERFNMTDSMTRVETRGCHNSLLSGPCFISMEARSPF